MKPNIYLHLPRDGVCYPVTSVSLRVTGSYSSIPPATSSLVTGKNGLLKLWGMLSWSRVTTLSLFTEVTHPRTCASCSHYLQNCKTVSRKQTVINGIDEDNCYTDIRVVLKRAGYAKQCTAHWLRQHSHANNALHFIPHTLLSLSGSY
ncbi:hypothetical protein MCAMS1_01219 [biofilm metagenome]